MWYNFYQHLFYKRPGPSGRYVRRRLIGRLSYCTKIGLVAALAIWFDSSCKSYNLERATFPTCAKPSAAISYTTDQLEVVFALADRQGDVGAVGWDLGDGRHKNGERIKIAYSQPGTYMVTIILANTCDDHFTASRSVTVTK